MPRILFLLLFFAIGCVPSAKQDTLYIHLGAEPPTLDSSRAESVVDIRILQNISEPLLEYDEKLHLLNAMAEKWEISADGLTYYFELKKGKVWSDGKPLTAENYRYAILRTLNPNVESKLSYLLYPIKNAKAYKIGHLKNASEVGVTAPSDYNLVVRLEEPASDFIHAFANAVTFPLREDIVTKFGDKYGSEANIISSGPFKLDEWKHDQYILLTKNRLYGGSGSQKPQLQTIKALIVPELTTALTLFETGKIDILEQIPLEGIQRLQNDPRMHVYPDFSTYFIGFNVRNEPFKDKRVRKAFIKGINRDSLQKILSGGQPIALSFIPPGLTGYNDHQGIKFNLSEAKVLLKEAGYPEGKNFPKVELAFNAHERHQQIAEWLEQELRINLGIAVTLKSEEWKVYLSTLTLSPPPLYRFAWSAIFPDPLSPLLLWTKDNPNNYSGWSSPRYDSLVREISRMEDSPARTKKVEEAQKIIVEEDPPFIPLYFYSRNILVSPTISGFKANGLGVMGYKNVTKSLSQNPNSTAENDPWATTSSDFKKKSSKYLGVFLEFFLSSSLSRFMSHSPRYELGFGIGSKEKGGSK